MNGWIKLYRSLLTWEWFKDSETLHVFIYLLLQANHEPGKWKGIEIKQGQLITGRKVIAENTGVSERSIRTALNRLKSTNELTIKTTNKYSLITICNYDRYQSIMIESDHQNDQQPDQQTTSKRPANDHKQEGKEFKKDIVPTSKKFIPPSIKQIEDYCKERKNIIDPERFLDFYTANGWMQGKGKPIKDWKAAVRTWEKNGYSNNHHKQVVEKQYKDLAYAEPR